MTADPIQEAAELIATAMIDAARNSGSEPVVFVTGNRYFPALRSFHDAEEIWQLDGEDHIDDWQILCETIDELLDAANVQLDGHPDDNCLYVVDCARFEYDEDSAEESDTLSGMYRPIPADSESA